MPRPLKDVVDPDKQVTISLRVPGELRTQLERVAVTQDRTLSQESERRLRRSLSQEDLVADFIGVLRAERECAQPGGGVDAIMQLVLRAAFGAEVGDKCLQYGKLIAYRRQGARPSMWAKDLQEAEAELDAAKALWRDDQAAAGKLPKRR